MIRKQRGKGKERKREGEGKKEKENSRRYYRAAAIDVIRATTRIVHWTATLAEPETLKTNFR